MPISFNIKIGRFIGFLIYLAGGKRRMVAHSNLRAAFSKEKSPEKIDYLTRRVYERAGETFSEILSLTKIDKNYIDKYIKVHNRQNFEKISKNNKGLIFVSAHFGNWELSTIVSKMNGVPLSLLARDQKMMRLNELLNRLRESKGSMVIRKGLDVKNIFKLLKDGKNLGILADQNAGHSGKFLPFFSRPASSAIGPYRFAQKTGAWILPAFIHRINGPYHELYLEEPMVISENEDIAPYMMKYNSLLEKHIRKSPEQWFWMHKKWKVTPLRKVLVLDDGRKGHLKQSLAIVEIMKKYRLDKGFKPEDMEVNVIKVEYVDRKSEILMKFLAPFVSYRGGMRLMLLRAMLTRSSYKKLVKEYADIIVSAGSSLYGVNRILKIENFSKNIAVLDPGWFNRNSADLIIIPKHDANGAIQKRKNIVITDMAPNLIDKDYIKILGEKLEVEKNKKHHGKHYNIGFLIGGDNKDFTLKEELVNNIFVSLEEVCAKYKIDLYISTSRRTNSAIEKNIEEFLKNSFCIRKYVSGKNDKDSETIEKFLAFSDIVIVTGESISMVSEAVSSGKEVLVVMPDKKTGRFTKHERFIDNLNRNKKLRIVSPCGIQKLIVESIMFPRGESASCNDNEKIREKLYRIF
ncbi:Bacterial lipid A biosynthesis acyltransferase [Candidatus Omnitrophus magneticus]|uniref:Bacterial lipid A biosynthesis acyltransferase n=1 Tax=Candidatus Omnitrophus magneticus TaxID=1609969 RepID=A0A0F0CVH7_9BACT|nr:Bacterial lipid A biosynthesis acyltransferase [Candidatus Omnitrophus magneticus]